MTTADKPAEGEHHGWKDARQADSAQLKGLAHPLRIAIFDALTTYGPSTSAMLASRLGESTGSMSYHLRQLARHGFIVEVEEQGTARERYWRRAPGALAIGIADDDPSPAMRRITDSLVREMTTLAARRVQEFASRAADELPVEWMEASSISSATMELTVEELAELVDDVAARIEARRQADGGRRGIPGARRVQVQFHAFPLMDAEPTP